MLCDTNVLSVIGFRGVPGATPNITITSETGDPGTPVEVERSGTNLNPVFHFTIPGSAQVSVGSVSTLNPGSQATVVDGNPDLDKVVLNFGIPQGLPGLNGTGVVVETLVALRGVTGTALNETVTMLGYRTANDGGGGLWVWKSFVGTLADAVYDNGGTYVKPTGYSGQFRWERIGAFTQPANPLWWGAYRDNTNAAITTAAIQAAVDWAIYGFVSNVAPSVTGRVFVPSGIYAISDTIHLCYSHSNNYRTIIFEGDGMAYPNTTASTQFAGTIFVANFNDRPAIAVQGTRNAVVQNIGIVGTNAPWVTDNRLGNTAPGPLMDDIPIENWVDPTFPAASSSRYAPYAGIAIDPYCGTRPAVSYPDVNYPSWLGTTTQYQKGISSNTLIRNVAIDGFVVGVVNKPSDDDGNADFTKLDRVNITKCQYGISICNSQARLNQFNNVSMARVHTCITTGTHGKQLGKPLIQANSCQFANCTRWIHITSLSIGGSATFNNCYGEIIYSIGLATGGNSDCSVRFQNCDFGFSNSWTDRGPPRTVFERTGAGNAVFDGCVMTCGQVWIGMVFKGRGIGVRNCMVIYSDNYPWLDKKGTTLLEGSALHYALKATKGFVFVPNVSERSFPVFFENNGLSISGQAWYTNLPTVCVWERVTADALTLVNTGVPITWKSRSVARNAGSNMTLVGNRVYTFQLTIAAATAYQRHQMPGDILVDQTTGIAFLITANGVGTTNTLTLLALTGYDNNTVLRTTDPNGYPVFDLTSGTFWAIPGKLASADVAAGKVIYGTTTAANAVATAVRSDDAVGTWLTPTAWVTNTQYYAGSRVSEGGTNYYYCLGAHKSGTFATDLAAGYWVALPAIAEQSNWNGHITVGDYVQSEAEIETTVSVSTSNITAVTQTTFTTLGNWANSATRRRLPLFIKKAPPNITDPRLP